MSLPTLKAQEALPKGLDAWFEKVRGWSRRHPSHARKLRAQARQTLVRSDALVALDDSSLDARVADARVALQRDPAQAQGQLVGILALVTELSRRTLGMRPYEVQLMGALALHRGWLAEMATGEGKTLTVALAAVLAAWSGRPCHVVTANEYLAQRDAQSMQPLYASCRLEVSTAVGEVAPEQRQPCYLADVVYVTAKTLLADHLRDELATRRGSGAKQEAFLRWRGFQGRSVLMLSRGLHTAIVDEADSVLIDEAVTPLILSAPREVEGLHEAVRYVAAWADLLTEGHDYLVQAREQRIELGRGAHDCVERGFAQLPAGWRTVRHGRELLTQALTVRRILRRQQHYLVRDGKVVLLDEFTGRMMPERSLSSGLHQAIEALEGVEMTHPNESVAQMSFQSFFRRMPKLSGTTGTAHEARDEMWQIYKLGVVRVPTHRPRKTVVDKPLLFSGEASKWDAVAQHVKRLYARGQPVLIGVRSVGSSQVLLRHLQAVGLRPMVLNAEAHEQEAQIIANAGRGACVTVATNMAGRGTDIHVDAESLRRGGLHVVIAEPNDSARIDRQLAGRCGRQGQPGSVQAVLSPDDALLQRYLNPWQRRTLRHLARTGVGTWTPRWLHTLSAAMVRSAQGRAESDAFARRASVLRADEWLERALPFDDIHTH